LGRRANGSDLKREPRRRKFRRGAVSKLPHAAGFEEVFGAYDLAMQRSRDQSVALDFAGLGVGNADVIHVQSAPERPLVIGFGFLKVG
jgi:hypothetical protein